MVSFYADGHYVGQVTDPMYVPSSPGKIILSHWSNGAPGWSAGPPVEDAKLLVQYVKAYFNSSEPTRQNDHSRRCPNPSVAKGICQIPDQKGAPTLGGVPFFHTDPSGNKANNQSVYAVSARSAGERAAPALMGMLVTAGLVGAALVWGV